jgi:hypothetical protein
LHLHLHLPVTVAVCLCSRLSFGCHPVGICSSPCHFSPSS